MRLSWEASGASRTHASSFAVEHVALALDAEKTR